MTRLAYVLSLLALIALGAGCWEAPFNGSTIATRNTSIHFRGYIPVPGGRPLPTQPVRIFAEGAQVGTRMLSASEYSDSLGGFDWYVVEFDLVIPNARWTWRNGRYESGLTASIQAAPPVTGNTNNYILPFFDNAGDMSCVANNLAGGSSYYGAWDGCNVRVIGMVYATAP